MGDIEDDGIGPEAYAAYDARKLTAHEIGTWPAFRDGYAAGLAARTPGPDVARLLAAAKDAQAVLAYADHGRDEPLVYEALCQAIAEHEAAKGTGG